MPQLDSEKQASLTRIWIEGRRAIAADVKKHYPDGFQWTRNGIQGYPQSFSPLISRARVFGIVSLSVDEERCILNFPEDKVLELYFNK